MLVLCAKQPVVSKMCALYALQYEYSYRINTSGTIRYRSTVMTLQLNSLSADTFLLLLKHKLTNIYSSLQLFLLLKFEFVPALTLSVAAVRLILGVFFPALTLQNTSDTPIQHLRCRKMNNLRYFFCPVCSL